MPDQRTVTVDLGSISGTTADAWWYDPRTGVPSYIGGFSTTGNQDFTPPTAADWVLVIDDDSRGFSPPG